MTFVDLLWTLKGHSLGQSEDQVKVISCLHFILLVDIIGGLSSFGSFFCKHSELSRSVRLLPLQVFFNGKLAVRPHRIPMFLPRWLNKGMVSYPPKVQA
jgi:hypothetical protein